MLLVVEHETVRNRRHLSADGAERHCVGLRKFRIIRLIERNYVVTC